MVLFPKQYHVTFSTTCEIIKKVSIIKIVPKKSDSGSMYDHTLWSHFIHKVSSLKQRLTVTLPEVVLFETRSSVSSQCKTSRSSSKRTPLCVAL